MHRAGVQWLGARSDAQKPGRLFKSLGAEARHFLQSESREAKGPLRFRYSTMALAKRGPRPETWDSNSGLAVFSSTPTWLTQLITTSSRRSFRAF